MLVGLCVGAGTLGAQAGRHTDHALGTVDFPVSCSVQARSEFNRAVALLHHMTYPQAREAFQRVATTDPLCAMAHWGIAMSNFHPLWVPPTPAELQKGSTAAAEAMSSGDAAS